MSRTLQEKCILTSESTSETQSCRLAQIKIEFYEQENGKLLQQVRDLQETLDINKQIICDLL